MDRELKSTLDFFCRQSVDIILKGDEKISEFHDVLPSTWVSALSRDLSVSEAIEALWAPIRKHAEQTIETLRRHVNDLALVVFPSDTSLRLLYVFQKSTSRGVQQFGWLAGLPLMMGENGECEWKAPFQLPESYKLFLDVHNGFLREGWDSLGLRPASKLYFISELFTNQNTLVDKMTRQLLAFCGDGAGNEQCYNLTLPFGNGDYFTVDWDHETRVATKPERFWVFLDRFISQQMGS